ncbi:MAG TPA: hypothetical protein VKV32_07180, partial [Stellaceae bacterium]|nr:hypothetical protein [Stellaceae bacterium]
MRSSSSSSLGDLAVCGIFAALSIVAGALVVTFILFAASPIVAMFPLDSGASEIVTCVAMMWGVVTCCVVAVYTIGPWRRIHSRAQIERFDATGAVPLEMIGRPVPRRRVANDARLRHFDEDYADAYADAEEELLLED